MNGLVANEEASLLELGGIEHFYNMVIVKL